MRSLMHEGQKIEAIKLYRERTGAGLKASKDAVEALAERQGNSTSRGTGCFGLVVVALGVLAGALAFADDHHSASISEAQRDQHGLMIHTVLPPSQSGKTGIRLVLSDTQEKDIR